MLSLRLENPAPLPLGGRIREIDELKGWAMLLVLIYHIGGVFDLPNWFHGEVGVDVFLIISGFTLTRSSQEIPWKQFLRRRLLRIYPAYWLALGFFCWLSSHYYGVHRSAANLVLHFLGVHGFAAPDFFSDINDSFWFISLILMLYVVFLWLRRKLGDLSTVVGAGLLLNAAFTFFYLGADHSGGLGHLAVRIPSFFIGIVAAQFMSAKSVTLTMNPALAAGLAFVAYLGCSRGVIPFYPFAGVAATAIFLVLRQSLQKHPDGRFFLSALALMGVYSYEIFLFHQPLIRDYNRLFWSRAYDIIHPSTWQLVLGVVGGILLTFAISFLVHQLTNRLFAWRKSAAPVA
jgi:peptidoglycan/LPS O-acetylase OafA/YrhL